MESLKHLAVETILDGRPMEGIACQELLEHSLKLLDTTLDGGLVQKISDWELVTSPVPDTTLDGRPMEGTTNLEHSVLVESLDSGLMAGMSSLEPLEQSVLNTLLVARPGEGITENISDWELVAHPVPDTTLDGRPMEGTTNLEHSVLVGSLDSGLMAGMSSLEPLEQSVLNTLLVARPGEGITENISDRELVAHPVPDTTLDGRPMEGTTNLEHSVLVGSLDSGLMAGMSRLEPLERLVLNTLLVAQPVEVITETPERSALASQVDYGQLELESLSRPMVNVALDRRSMEGIAAPLPVESSGLTLAPDSGHVEDLPSSGPLEHSVLDVKRRNDNLNRSDEPQFGSDLRQSSLELEDAIRLRY